MKKAHMLKHTIPIFENEVQLVIYDAGMTFFLHKVLYMMLNNHSSGIMV